MITVSSLLGGIAELRVILSEISPIIISIWFSVLFLNTETFLGELLTLLRAGFFLLKRLKLNIFATLFYSIWF